MLLLAAATVGAAAAASAKTAWTARPVSRQESRRYASQLAQLPLSFEENAGQFPTPVRYSASGKGYRFCVTPEGAALSLRRQARGSRSETQVAMRLLGGNPAAKLSGERQLPGRVNYLRGNDPRAWRTNIPTFGKVRGAGVYPGVDVVYYGSGQKLEYDFVVQPGADARQIRLGYQDPATGRSQKPRVDGDGNLVLKVDGGALVQHRPVCYQEQGGRRQIVAGKYAVMADGSVGFRLGAYDPTRALVIDPTLIYSTYFGGEDDDAAGCVAVDGRGDVYLVGTTASTRFPLLTPLTTNRKLSGDTDVFLTKVGAGTLTLSGASTYVASTYIGGSGDESAGGVAVDSQQRAWVVGTTTSANFPTQSPLQATNKAPDGGTAFVVRLSASGSALDFGSYYGGSGSDAGHAVQVDAAGNAYVAGDTLSETDFPATAHVGPGGFQDAFVLKINAGAGASGPSFTRSFATVIGGTGPEQGLGLALWGGKACVVGSTGSEDFPTQGAFQGQLATGGPNDFFPRDAFVTLLNDAGTGALASTFLGGKGGDQANGVAIDGTGKAVVVGGTNSVDFPTTAGALQTQIKGTAGPNGYPNEAFVSQLDLSGSTVQLLYSTLLGGEADDVANGVALDKDGVLWVTGFTQSSNFPVQSPLQAHLAGVADPGGVPADAFLIALLLPAVQTRSPLLFSTYLGGTGYDGGVAVAAGADGSVWVAGYTLSSNSFPTTPDALFKNNAGSGSTDAFLARVTLLNAPAKPVLTATVPGQPDGQTSVNLAWTGADGATGCQVFWNVSGSATDGGSSPALSASALSYTVTGLKPATKYAFKVVALNGPLSTASDLKEATTLSAPLAMPTDLSATLGTAGSGAGLKAQTMLSWSYAGTGVTYTVQRSTDGMNFTDVKTGLTTTTFTDDVTALRGNADVVLTYRAVAVKVLAVSAPSNTGSVTLVGAPTNVTVTQQKDGNGVVTRDFLVTFTDNSSAETGFAVTANNVAINPTITGDAVKSFTYTGTTVINGGTLTISVTATGAGADSKTVTATATLPTPPLAAPTGLSATLGTTGSGSTARFQGRLAWSYGPVKGVKFIVQRSTDGVSFTDLKSGLAGRKYVDNLTALRRATDVVVTYQVIAVRKQGGVLLKSGPSNKASVTIPHR